MGVRKMVRLWPEVLARMGELQAAQAAWLEATKQDDPTSVAGLQPWTLEMAVNAVLGEYSDRMTNAYRLSLAAIESLTAERSKAP